MAAVEELSALKAQMLLNNGTTTSGAVRTVNVSMGTLEPSAWDAQKALNIINALYPCLNLMLYRATKTATYDLSED